MNVNAGSAGTALRPLPTVELSVDVVGKEDTPLSLMK